MRLTWATALTAVVLIAAPFAQATYEITATTCTLSDQFKWASSCYPATTQAGGYTFENQAGMNLTGPQYFRVSSPIAGAGEFEVIYQRECAAKDIKISVTVPAVGTYKVTLLESEIYFDSAKDGVNGCPRVFTVCTNDYMVSNDLCLYKAGVDKAVNLTNTYYVDSGSLELHLWSSVNMPKLGGIIVESVACTGDVKALKTKAAISTECANAAKGIYAPVASPMKPVAPGTNGTANATASPAPRDLPTGASPAPDATASPAANATASPAPEATASPAPVGPVLPAGPPVPVQTTRDLPKLPGGKAPLAASVSQFASGATAPEIVGAPDGMSWPAEAAAPADATATANFAVPVSPKGLALAGNFTKGDKVNVTVSGPGANGTAVSRDISLVAPRTGTILPVPMPKNTSADPIPATVSGVTIALPENSTAKIDAIKLDGAVAPGVLTTQESTDDVTGALTQWPISAADSVGSPGLGGAGTGSVFAPDGKVWAPSGNGTRDLTLNYTTPVNATHLLLAAAPKKGATVKVMGNPSDGSAPVELYSGPAAGDNTAAAPGTYGTYPLPLNASAATNLSSVTLSTADPKALALDSAALVGLPEPAAPAADGTPAPAGSRGVTLPIADGTPVYAASASTGAAVLPGSGVVPAGSLNGTDASNATGVPDGNTVAIPASASRGLALGATPFLSLDYPEGKKANIVAVAGKAVAPGTLRASVVDADGKITDLGAQALPAPADVNTYVNFTTPNNDVIDVRKVILTPTPAGSFVTDAVELNTASPEAIASSRGVTLPKKHKHRDGMHHRINGSRGAWIAVVTLAALAGFICCFCCLPFLLLAGKGKKTGATTGSYGAGATTAAAPSAGLFGFLKKKPAVVKDTTAVAV